MSKQVAAPVPPLAFPSPAGASPWPIGMPYRGCGQCAGQGRQGKAYLYQNETRFIHREFVRFIAVIRNHRPA